MQIVYDTNGDRRSGASVEFEQIKYLTKEQKGIISTENKKISRLCKMCNPLFYEFQVIPSTNVFQLIRYIVTLFTREAID
jgi:hypothetical protein